MEPTFLGQRLRARTCEEAHTRGQRSGRRSCLETLPAVARSIAKASLCPHRFFFLDSLIEACATPAALASLDSVPNSAIASSISVLIDLMFTVNIG